MMHYTLKKGIWFVCLLKSSAEAEWAETQFQCMERNICDGHGPEYATYGMLRQKPISTSEEKLQPSPPATDPRENSTEREGQW